MSKIALAEMIEELRSELETAVKQGDGKDIQFELGEITLEAQVEVSREAGGKAGLKFWVFTEAEASAGVSASKVHKLVLTLRAQRPDGGSLTLSRSPGA